MKTYYDEGGGNIWRVLDKLIACAIALAPYLMGTRAANDREVTLLMSDFTSSCGFTKEVSDLLFCSDNFRQRKLLTNLGVTFLNTNQVWEKKKLCFQLTSKHPHLSHLYTTKVLRDPVLEMGGDEPDVPPGPQPAPADVPQPVPQPAQQAGDIFVNPVGRKHMRVTYNNNKQVDWFKITAAAANADNAVKWSRFNRAFPKSHLRNIVTVAAGNAHQGAYLLTKQLLKMDRNAVQAMQDCGAGGLRKQSVRTIGRHIRALNNGHSVIASYKY